MRQLKLIGATCALLLAGGLAPAQAQQGQNETREGPNGVIIVHPPLQDTQDQARDPDTGTTGQGAMDHGMMMGGANPMGRGMMMGSGTMAGSPAGSVIMRVMFALMDADSDGTIELPEFQAAHERIFKAMDANKDGKLTLDEMRAFMQGRPAAPPP
jgi:hypothetical protein